MRALSVLLFLSLFITKLFAAPSPEDLLGPDSKRQPGVPLGTVTQYTWDKSKVFGGTFREYLVYVPEQYDATKPAALMVFQDGTKYADENNWFRIPVVFDNLILVSRSGFSFKMAQTI